MSSLVSDGSSGLCTVSIACHKNILAPSTPSSLPHELPLFTWGLSRAWHSGYAQPSMPLNKLLLRGSIVYSLFMAICAVTNQADEAEVLGSTKPRLLAIRTLENEIDSYCKAYWGRGWNASDLKKEFSNHFDPAPINSLLSGILFKAFPDLNEIPPFSLEISLLWPLMLPTSFQVPSKSSTCTS